MKKIRENDVADNKKKKKYIYIYKSGDGVTATE